MFAYFQFDRRERGQVRQMKLWSLEFRFLASYFVLSRSPFLISGERFPPPVLSVGSGDSHACPTGMMSRLWIWTVSTSLHMHQVSGCFISIPCYLLACFKVFLFFFFIIRKLFLNPSIGILYIHLSLHSLEVQLLEGKERFCFIF